MERITDEIEECIEQVDENTRLLNSKTPELRVYWYRWIILIEIGVFSLIQNSYGTMWGPIDKSAKAVYNMTIKDFYYIGIYANVGTALYIPINMWIIVNKGIKVGVLLGVVFTLVGLSLPLLPLANRGKIITFGIGQLINGFALGPVVCVPAYISNVWFSTQERILATGIMTLIGYLGAGSAFFFGPILVKAPNGTIHNATNVNTMRYEIERYIIIQLILGGTLFLAMILFFPKQPPTPPSNSAAAPRLELWKGLKTLARNKQFWVITLIFLFTYGTFTAWLGIMPLLYTQLSQKTTGLMGGTVFLLGAVVGIIICWIADRIQKSFYIIFIILTITAFLSTTYVVIISLNWSHTAPFGFTEVGLWISFCILGTTMNSFLPISIELVATVSYPVDEGTSSHILVWIAVIYGAMYYLVLNGIPDINSAQYILLVSVAVAMPLLYFSKPKSNPRLDLDIPSKESETPNKEINNVIK